MKLKFSIFLIFLLIFSIEAADDYAIEDSQVENVVKILRQTFDGNEKIRETFVSIVVVDLTKNFNTNKFLIKIQANLDVVVNGVSNGEVVIDFESPDYVIFLQNDVDEKFGIRKRYETFLASATISTSVKIILINLHPTQAHFDTYSRYLMYKSSNLLIQRTFTNVLIISAIGNNIPTQHYRKNRSSFAVHEGVKFPMWKMGELHVNKVSVAFYNQPPYTILDKQSKLYGLEGQVIDEFCKRQNVTYEVKTNPKELNVKNILDNLHIVDLSLNTQSYVISTYLEPIWLFENDGWCLLLPRNIPTFSLTEPLKLVSFVLLFISTFLIILIWTIIKKYQGDNYSLTHVIFSVYDMLLGNAAESNRWRRWTRKEQFLIFPFLFAQIILVGLVQSWFISYMINKPAMRSAATLEEFNETQTMIYMYFEEFSVKFPREKIITLSQFTSENFWNTIPKTFNRDLAYILDCQFANFFVQSQRNFDGNLQLFDVFEEPISKVSSVYMMSQNFPLKNEFRNMVEGLRESGVRSFLRQKINERLSKIRIEKEDRNYLQFSDMRFLFGVLFYGWVLGLLVLIVELSLKGIKRLKEARKRRIREREMRILRKGRMIRGRVVMLNRNNRN